MDTNKPDMKEAYKMAVAAEFDVLKNRPGEKVTFEALATKSGIKIRQLHYLLSGERAIHMGDFYSLCVALGVEPETVVRAAASRAAKMVS